MIQWVRGPMGLFGFSGSAAASFRGSVACPGALSCSACFLLISGLCPMRRDTPFGFAHCPRLALSFLGSRFCGRPVALECASDVGDGPLGGPCKVLGCTSLGMSRQGVFAGEHAGRGARAENAIVVTWRPLHTTYCVAVVFVGVRAIALGAASQLVPSGTWQGLPPSLAGAGRGLWGELAECPTQTGAWRRRKPWDGCAIGQLVVWPDGLGSYSIPSGVGCRPLGREIQRFGEQR